MSRTSLLQTVRHCVRKIFQKRSIIVISERNVGHYHISGRVQCAVMFALILFVCGVSYSTGNYMAARSMIEEQDQTIRSVTKARVEQNFLLGSSTSQSDDLPANSAVPLASLAELESAAPVAEPTRLFARIAFLETRVKELKDENEEIVQAIRERTKGKISDLEAIIGRTGLSLSKLQIEERPNKSKEKQRPAAARGSALGSQGGPYMPVELTGSIVEREKALFDTIDRLMLLERIVDSLPLGSPMKGGEFKSGFGKRIDPFTGRFAFHAGIDLSGRQGAKVYSTGSGKVLSAGRDGAYGLAVDIDHGLGLITRYGHLSGVDVQPGDSVKRGQLIGRQGTTGRSTGPHLHYEVRHFNKPLNPHNFLSSGAANVF